MNNIFRTIFSIVIWPLTLFVFVVLVAIYGLLTYFISPVKLSVYVRIASRIILLCSGQILKVEGNRPNKNNQPYLYLFNHESLLDPFMFGGSVTHYVTAVGANYQFSYPVWGWLARRHGAIPIKRNHLKAAINSLDEAEQQICQGISFFISPEGTRTLTGKLGPFKKGPFHVAKNTGVTIIPTALIGAYQAKRKSDWRLSPGVLTIRFGQPIVRQEFDNYSVEELRDVIHTKIENLLRK